MGGSCRDAKGLFLYPALRYPYYKNTKEPSFLHQFAEPDEQGIELLRMAMEKLSLSARAYNRILKVARTIADLAGSEQIKPDHIAEAVGYRTLDRGDWAERGHL